jgi:hypothetical protein
MEKRKKERKKEGECVFHDAYLHVLLEFNRLPRHGVSVDVGHALKEGRLKKERERERERERV